MIDFFYYLSTAEVLKSVHDSDGSFFPEKNILMFHEVTTVLNERELLKMVIRSVPDYVSIIVDRAKWHDLAALRSAHQL